MSYLLMISSPFILKIACNLLEVRVKWVHNIFITINISYIPIYYSSLIFFDILLLIDDMKIIFQCNMLYVRITIQYVRGNI